MSIAGGLNVWKVFLLLRGGSGMPFSIFGLVLFRRARRPRSFVGLPSREGMVSVRALLEGLEDRLGDRASLGGGGKVGVG